MEQRRSFLKAAAGAAVVSQTVRGANNRVQMGIIGIGTRGNQVHQSFMRNNDVTFVAACEVQRNRLDQFATKAGGKMATYGDYRRLLDNKDVEAVLITAPDHWHSPMLVAACDAGKDVYCEKPVSNAIEPALRMVEAVRRTKRVVQIGCQQRSWQHFQDCGKMILDGYLGQINHCLLLFGGGGGGVPQPPEKPQDPPPDLDWEMFQGPAPRRPFVPSRLRWRSWWDYGGGSITDWGVHLTDVMHWYMNADAKAPLLTSGMGQYVNSREDPERAPDTFTVIWKFDKFVATFTNAVPPPLDPSMGMSDQYGNYFFGQRGMLLVNRYGHEWRPSPQRVPAGRGAPQSQTPPPQPPPIKAEKIMDAKGMSEDPDSKFGSPTVRHTRNFLDCVKSRQRPVCDMEIGFNSTLPTLLAVLSIRQGRSFTWDGKQARPA
ncbi:MAG: Gfo/Idh/MocA family oxidoreductase [Bryobacterales bacterium]|nr:Gfo/Idh/MocA family oxidoreductase [Bryobacterales bacterium]